MKTLLCVLTIVFVFACGRDYRPSPPRPGGNQNYTITCKHSLTPNGIVIGVSRSTITGPDFILPPAVLGACRIDYASRAFAEGSESK